jgi:hypothetical protein
MKICISRLAIVDQPSSCPCHAFVRKGNSLYKVSIVSLKGAEAYTNGEINQITPNVDKAMCLIGSGIKS